MTALLTFSWAVLLAFYAIVVSYYIAKSITLGILRAKLIFKNELEPKDE